MEYCSQNVPRWNTLNIAGYHFREAGANAVQELAFPLADAIAYIEAAPKRGMEVDKFAPRLSYSLGCFMDFFEEVCKFRAARRLYARIMKDRFKAQNPKSYLFRIFTGSCGSTLMAQQPINNIVRVTMHALMGILGGDQAIHTACWDEAYAIPSDNSALMALRTQQILAEECGLTSTIDPLAGSYYVESLTSKIKEKAQEYLEAIDRMGGMLAAIEKGYVHKEIQDSSVEFQNRANRGQRTIVGLNKYQSDLEEQVDQEQLFELDPEVEPRQRDKLAKVRAQRDQGAAQRALEDIEAAIEADQNLMPSIIQAADPMPLSAKSAGLCALNGASTPRPPTYRGVKHG